MGTETLSPHFSHMELAIPLIKLNNPLMGTETKKLRIYEGILFT